MRKQNRIKTNKGITLIALIITIIVLLILAGVAISVLTGDNGLITKTTDAKGKNLDAEIEEEIRLAWNKVYGDAYIGQYSIDEKAGALRAELRVKDIGTEVSGKGTLLSIENYRGKNKVLDVGSGKIADTEFDLLPSVVAGGTAQTKSVYKSGNDTAIIPAGFTVSATESSIENGLVVKDGSNNEWVWIPVSSSDLALMYTEDNTGWIMLGTTAPNEVVSKFKTLETMLGNKYISRNNPGLTSNPNFREPDVLSSYDTEQTFQNQAGFEDLTDMATKLKDDYKEMIDSVKTNGGFFVGRYELGKDSSNNPQVKAGNVMNNTNWYQLYSACKSFSNGNVESRMIWGCQWDQICRFIKGNGANSIIEDSRSYGNYRNSTGDAAINSGGININGTTGQLNDNWKIKNIYDMAGNFTEWTQEACNTFQRAVRGRELQRQRFF